MTEFQISLIKRLIQSRQTVIRVIIAEAKGSTPRNSGSSMLVWRNLEGKLETFDTIGGGFLEERAIEIAQLSLLKIQEKNIVQSFILGANLDQCCGGVVHTIWERFEFLSDIEWLLSIENHQAVVRRILDLKMEKLRLFPDVSISDGLNENKYRNVLL
jgi:xanthine dehydrogenase accessory factor